MATDEYRRLPFVKLKNYSYLRGHKKGEGEPCVRCGDPIATVKRMVHLIDGGSALLHPEDEDLYQSDDGDMLWFPLGPDCACRIGLEWSVELETYDFGPA